MSWHIVDSIIYLKNFCWNKCILASDFNLFINSEKFVSHIKRIFTVTYLIKFYNGILSTEVTINFWHLPSALFQLIPVNSRLLMSSVSFSDFVIRVPGFFHSPVIIGQMSWELPSFEIFTTIKYSHLIISLFSLNRQSRLFLFIHNLEEKQKLLLVSQSSLCNPSLFR